MWRKERDIIHNLVSIKSFREALERSDCYIKIKNRRFQKQSDHIKNFEYIDKISTGYEKELENCFYKYRKCYTDISPRPSLLSLILPSCIVVARRELVNTSNISTLKPQNSQLYCSKHLSIDIEVNLLKGHSFSLSTNSMREIFVNSSVFLMDYTVFKLFLYSSFLPCPTILKFLQFLAKCSNLLQL